MQSISVDPIAHDRIQIVPDLHPVGGSGFGRGLLHVTCDGKHAEGSPFEVRLQPANWIWNQLSKAPAEGPADRHTPIYGEINETGVARILSWWRDNAGLGADSVFMEAGSGRGKPCFLAKLQYDVGTVIGIEVVPERRFIGEYIRRVLLRSGISSMDDISFLVSDLCVGAASPMNSAIAAAGEHDKDVAMDTTPWSALTHWYTFDTGFPPDVMEAVGTLINRLIHRGGALEHFACFHSPDRLAEVGFDMKALRLAYKTVVNMEGSAQGHTCYVYSTQAKLALEKWTEEEGLYVDPETLEMICPSSEEDSGDDEPEPISLAAGPQANVHKWITMQIQVPKGMVPGQVCKIFDPDGRPHFVKIPRECRPLPGKSVSDLHFVKQVPTRYTTSVLRTLDSDELRQWLRHRGQKLPRNSRYEVLLEVACDYINQAQNPAPRVPQGWQTHWSGEYKRWYFVHAEKNISSWEHPHDKLEHNEPPANPKPVVQTKVPRRRVPASEAVPKWYAELFCRIPKHRTAQTLAQEFNDRELRMIMKCNGIMLNTLDSATDKYIEKSKLEKCKALVGTVLRRPARVAAASKRGIEFTGKLSKTQLMARLPRELSWNEFQREAVAAGYSKLNADLAEAWHHYKHPSGAAPSTQNGKTIPTLTAAQRQAAHNLSQNYPGLLWNEFQRHDRMQAMIDRLDGGTVNKNSLLAAIWRQYQADQEPAASTDKLSTPQCVTFSAGEKVVWVLHDDQVLESEIGICTGNFDEDGDPELKFTIGGWVGYLPCEELIKLHPNTYVPSQSAPASVIVSAKRTTSSAAAPSRAPKRHMDSSTPVQRKAAAERSTMCNLSRKITKERNRKIQNILSAAMTVEQKVAEISLALRSGRKDINLQDFTDAVAATGLPVSHFSPEMYKDFWRGSDPYHGAPLKKRGNSYLSDLTEHAASPMKIPVPITAPTSRKLQAPKLQRTINNWTKAEEDFLVQYVMQHGARHWGRCSAELGTGRTGSACAQHYRIFLRPTHRHKEGTIAGKQPQLADSSSARANTQSTSKGTASAAGADSSSRLPSRQVPGTWTEREDDVLVEHVERKGVGSWVVAAASVSAVGAGRSPSSCRSHYFDTIAPQQRAKPAPPLISTSDGSDIYASLPSGLDWKSFQDRIRVFGNAASTYWRAYRSRPVNPGKHADHRTDNKHESEDCDGIDDDQSKDQEDDESDAEHAGEHNDEGDMEDKEDEDEDDKEISDDEKKGIILESKLVAKLHGCLTWNDFQREAANVGSFDSNTVAEAWSFYKKGRCNNGNARAKNKRGPCGPIDAPPPKKRVQAISTPAPARRKPRPPQTPGPVRQRHGAADTSGPLQSYFTPLLRKRPAGISAGGRRGRVRKQVVRAGMVDITRPGFSLVCPIDEAALMLLPTPHK